MAGLAVLYRWKLHPGSEASFIEAWSRVTALLRERGGSLGSRLHRGNDGVWYGYAQWPSAEARELAFAQHRDPVAGAQMRAAVAESLPEILLEPVSDYLVSAVAALDRTRNVESLPLRLSPGEDLRTALEAQVAASPHSASFVVSGIGSLVGARLRFAGARDPEDIDGPLEILTLAGTLATNGSHLHMSVADSRGRVFGGHAARGCIVRTTAEILLLRLPDWSFAREIDPATGFAELVASRLAADAA